VKYSEKLNYVLMAKYFLDREFYDMVRENEEVLHELD
jgi:hypothetical protein